MIQIDQLSVEVLEQLAEDLLDFSQLDDLSQWWQEHQSKQPD